jgi:hypothetical protein
VLTFTKARLFVLWGFVLLCSTRATPAVAQEQRTSGQIQSSMMEVKLKRMELQLKAFKQFESMRNRNLQRERRKHDILSDRHRSATMFFNGRNSPVTRAAFNAAIEQSELSPGSAEVFQTSVPPLGADQFATTGLFADILRPDGMLRQAPPVLVGGSRNRPLDAARVELEERWGQTLRLIGSESVISGDDVAMVQVSLDRWERLAANKLARSNLLARVLGQKYLASVRSLIRTVENPAHRQKLQSYCSGSGPAFEGGTVADLVRHVERNNLSVRTGSRAQLILSELGHDTLRDLNAQCELADQRAEYFTVQNAQSRLDASLYGAHLPQRRDAPRPGDVPTSVERVGYILDKNKIPRTPRESEITDIVTRRESRGTIASNLRRD